MLFDFFDADIYFNVADYRRKYARLFVHDILGKSEGIFTHVEHCIYLDDSKRNLSDNGREFLSSAEQFTNARAVNE